jgi:thiamine-phosphate pyrophosphorylase
MSNRKVIEKLHYLTQDDVSGFTHAQLAEKACEAGVKWVQFRSKKLTGNALLDEVKRAKEIADKYNATLVINDHVHLAQELGLGVHLGKMDMPVSQAREILGDKAIIGGTANTKEDIIRLIDQGADYIGLGPYRFTVTKQNLSPVISSDELEKLLSLQNQAPIIVIGGIKPEDVRPIIQAGAHGVAVSSAINLHPDKVGQVHQFLKAFEMEVV